ncbi:deoxyribodipyrimidine photolyase [Anaeromyxobacter diazotrophicus]|uniref:Deoxyribodipyrimidine photo-lyase n=1 Tax=Anaeromyxobacter diazotrophicus TaxID=2590199 RepID=A0A7I9VKS7_9BACT|nr:deoxyribodipyrimidine photolyase [Anaeromyxobacter diazotrophicus]GEJ57024.1 deoxyribodipyrimidine photo-lyase [Anaeromyxobacter diazotrophicus]
MKVPTARLRALNAAPLRPDGRYVVYWMVAARRASHSFALDRAIGLARELARPLVVLEALRAGYPHASDRLHRFVLQGMAEQAAAFARARVVYHPYVEARAGDGRGLLEALAAEACAVVTDDFPTFFLPRMLAAAGARLAVRLEAVDGNGLLPVAAATRVFPTAHAFRRFLQSELPEHLTASPSPHPFRGQPLPEAPPLPPELLRRWPAATPALLAGDAAHLARLPIDHAVPPSPIPGGTRAARAALRRFVEERLARYARDRNHPDLDAGSGLSPWLHFGHLSAHEVFRAVAEAERWTPARLGARPRGQREGWWGTSPSAEAFLDQLVTWRELGFNMAAKREDHAAYGSLPGWARATLAKHAADPRPAVYGRAALEEARTGDPLWNAAQRQLRGEGRIHGYLRMLWGKKILEWSRSPEEALETAVALNDRWALDGRDPCSYAGILWCFGRYDRPWGPERPVFGTVRYMTSANTARKLRLARYLARWGEDRAPAEPRAGPEPRG